MDVTDDIQALVPRGRAGRPRASVSNRPRRTGSIRHSWPRRFIATRGAGASLGDIGVTADDRGLLAHVDEVCPGLPGGVAWSLLASPHHVGLLSKAEFERRRSDAARNAGWTVGVGQVHVAGRPIETLLGTPDRRCGVRVLAVERCKDGVVVHAHRARRGLDQEGRYSALPDEILAEAETGWPAIPRLTLHDDAGTDYRGEIPPDRPLEVLEDEGIDEIAAAPGPALTQAAPPTASRHCR